MGTQLPSPKGAQPPIFGPCLLWPNGWMVKLPLGTEADLGAGDIVLHGDPACPPPNGGHCISQFWPTCCGQTATWIKMPLGIRVGPGPGHIVLHEDPAPP